MCGLFYHSVSNSDYNESGVRTRYLLKGSKRRDRYLNQSGSNTCYVMCYVLCVMCYVLCVMCYVLCVMCYVLRYVTLRYVMFFLLRDAPASEFSCRRFGTTGFILI
jgi:hypothetical protein